MRSVVHGMVVDVLGVLQLLNECDTCGIGWFHCILHFVSDFLVDYHIVHDTCGGYRVHLML